MTQKITLKAYTGDESYKSSAFASFMPEDKAIIESLDPKLPVEITLDGLDAGNAILFITHYGSDLVNALIKVYGTYERTFDSVTLRVTNGHTYHTAEELSDIYLEGLKVVL
mgnify:CR=1 FL=1